MASNKLESIPERRVDVLVILEGQAQHIGKLTEAVDTLKASRYQDQQYLINQKAELRAETKEDIMRVEKHVENLISGIKSDILIPLLEEVKGIKSELSSHRKIIWMGMGALALAGTLLELYRVFGK